VFHYEKKEGSFVAEVTLTGSYNVANALQCLGLLSVLNEKGAIKKVSEFQLLESLASFKGVQKRLENLGSFQGALVYRDFGHHPTAMACTLENLRQLYPKAKIIAGFEPKNATSRRNTFFKQYGEVLQSADQVFLLRAPEDKRIPENERMNVDELKSLYLKEKGFVLPDKEALKNWCSENFEEGDVSVFFSSSSFLDVPSELVLT
jgi:UDP-N-acetylmuramate: L-alanyl-gamma-D-glutamyl-meso-diaminopimelate ligase